MKTFGFGGSLRSLLLSTGWKTPGILAQIEPGTSHSSSKHILGHYCHRGSACPGSVVAVTWRSRANLAKCGDGNWNDPGFHRVAVVEDQSFQLS